MRWRGIGNECRFWHIFLKTSQNGFGKYSWLRIRDSELKSKKDLVVRAAPVSVFYGFSLVFKKSAQKRRSEVPSL
jgi:hypothetical protein